MALEGTFQDFGPAEIFQMISSQMKTGLLTVRNDDGPVVTVSFEKGMIVFADEYQRSEAERLGHVLLRTRRLTKEQLDQAIVAQKASAQRLGHVLVAQKLISQADLSQALQLQLKETVYRLFRWHGGSYHFEAKPVAYDRQIYVPLSAEVVMLEATRMVDEWPEIESRIPNFQIILARGPGGPPPATPPAPLADIDLEDLISIDDEPGAAPVASVDRAGAALGQREKNILALVDGKRTVQEIIDLGRLGDFETCKILFGLISLKLVVVSASAAPAADAKAPAPKKAGAGRFGPREYGMAAGAVVLSLTAFLFNPWGFVAQGFRASEGRRQSAALADQVRMRRVRLALEVHLLEKQAYPPSLDKLAESGLLRPGELKALGGARFVYRGGERDYRLDRETGR